VRSFLCFELDRLYGFVGFFCALVWGVTPTLLKGEFAKPPPASPSKGEGVLRLSSLEASEKSLPLWGRFGGGFGTEWDM